MVDNSVEAQLTTDIQLDDNTVMMCVEGVSEPSNSDNVTVTTIEEQVKQISNRKMVHSLKLSPLAMTIATAEMTRTHSDNQIYKAGVLLKPLNKRFQSDDTLNMDTGIALASSTPVQSLLAKKTTFVANSNTLPVANSNASPVANSNTSLVTNSNDSSTISSNISNHIIGEDPGNTTISEVSPAGLHKDDHSNVNSDHIVDGNTSESNAMSDRNDEDPGYSIIAEVLPNKEDLPVITTNSIVDNSNTVPNSNISNHIVDDSEDPGYSVIADVFPSKDQPSDLPRVTTNSSAAPVINSNIHINDDSEDPSYSVIAEVFPAGLHKDQLGDLQSINMTPVVNSNHTSTSDRNQITEEDPGYSSIAEVRPASHQLSDVPTVTTKQTHLTDPSIVYAKVNKSVRTIVTNDTMTIPADVVSSNKSSDNDPSQLYAKVNKSKQTDLVSAGNTLDGAKVTFADEADSSQLSPVASIQDEVVTLRHGPGANNLKVKSSSSQDLKDNVVNDPRRHSAMPASPQDYSVVEDKTTTESSKFEPTYDEDWRNVSSSDKLQVNG